MSEVWRTISRFPAYQVSDMGRLRRAKPGRGAVVGTILKPFLGGKPGCKYFYATLRQDGATFKIRLNRLVALAFIGPAPTSLYQVAHNDGNRLNNLRSNLRWTTNQENRDDMRRHGTLRVGERHGMARLTADSVAEIRRTYHYGNGALLARRFGVSRTTISRITTWHGWADTGHKDWEAAT